MAKFDKLKIAKRVKEELRSKLVRRGMIAKCGEKALLDPKGLRYPVMLPNKCQYSCKLIHAAYVRARQWKDNEIAKKALELMDKEDCWKELGLKREEHV